MELNITMIGGNCPVQAEGDIDGKPFYFRARGQHWSMSIGGPDPVSEPEGNHVETYGDGPFDAGWMSEDEARRCIDMAAAAWRSRDRVRVMIDARPLIAAHVAMFERYQVLLQQSDHDQRQFWLNFCAAGMALENPDKMSRWVGFLQGGLHAAGLIDITTERDVSRSIYKPVYDAIGLPSGSVTVEPEAEGMTP